MDVYLQMQAIQQSSTADKTGAQLAILWMGIGLAICILIVTAVICEAKKAAGVSAAATARYHKKFIKLSNNVLVRGAFTRLSSTVANMFVYTADEVEIQSVKWFNSSVGMSIAFIAATTIIYRDIVLELILVLFSVVIYSALVSDRARAIYSDMVSQASEAISSLEECYSQKSSVVTALSLCKKGPLVKLMFDRIIEIIEATDRDAELETFLNMKPYRLFQTLLCTCYIMSDSGDVLLSDGTSAFTNSLDIIKSDIDREIRKLKRIKIKFGILKYLPVVTLVGIPLIQKFFISNVPGTTYLYMGMFGYLTRILIILLAVVGYWVISTITDTQVVRSNDRLSTIDTLLENKTIYDFVKTIEPHKQRARFKMSERLRGCLSQKDITYITLSKLLSSCLTLFIALFSLFLIPNIAKDFTYKSIKSNNLNGDALYTIEQESQMYKLDCEYLDSKPRWSERELYTRIKANVPGFVDLQVLEQVERMQKKYDTYYSLKFHWYYIVIAYILALLGWYIPDLIISLRRANVKTEAKVDVMQMETLILILMHTTIDTQEMLKWLARTSTVHSEVLYVCYQEYPANQEAALEKLALQAATPEFSTMIERLATTAFDLSLSSAFHGLMTDREHRSRMLEMVDDYSIEKKRRIASKFALAPIIVLAVLYFLAPIGIVSFTSFVSEFLRINNSGGIM